MIYGFELVPGANPIPKMLERIPRPSARSIETMITAIPTTKPVMTRNFSRPFETRLKRGAAAQIPPMINRIAVGTTNSVGSVTKAGGLSGFLLLLFARLGRCFFFNLRHHKGLFGLDLFSNLGWDFW